MLYLTTFRLAEWIAMLRAEIANLTSRTTISDELKNHYKPNNIYLRSSKLKPTIKQMAETYNA